MATNDFLEINVIEAPISKVVLYYDHIDIVSGFKHQKVLESIKITEDNFLNKFISLPSYVNNLISTDRSLSYYLNGANTSHIKQSRVFIPDEDDYDNFTEDEFYKRSNITYSCPDEIIYLKEKINKIDTIYIFGKTVNCRKEYIIQIISGLMHDSNKKISNNHPYIEKEKYMKLSVCFSKNDIVYCCTRGTINYDIIDKNEKTKKFITAKSIDKKSNEHIIYANGSKDGFYITKNSDN